MTKANDFPEDRERVTSHIGWVVLDFFRLKLARNRRCSTNQFHASDLHRFVASKCPEAAPGSADRIMRVLRQGGRLDYVLVDRSCSQYAAVSVEPKLKKGRRK
jgi:hypothetical protein